MRKKAGLGMALQAGFNPFANTDLRMPSHLKEVVKDHSQQQRGTDPDVAPEEHVTFNRMVDAWLLAAAFGAATGQKVSVGKEGVAVDKFVTGAVLQNNPKSIEFLMNLAVYDTQDPYVVSEPKRMIQSVEQFVAGGMDQLLDVISSGHQDRVTNLMRGLLREFGAR